MARKISIIKIYRERFEINLSIKVIKFSLLQIIDVTEL